MYIVEHLPSPFSYDGGESLQKQADETPSREIVARTLFSKQLFHNTLVFFTVTCKNRLLQRICDKRSN